MTPLSSYLPINGYRYLLPVTCLLFIFSGWLLKYSIEKTAGLVVICVSFIPLLTAIAAFPNYLVYTNALIADKKMAYRYLADSNFNWGQRTTALQKFLAAHPASVFEPAAPATGMIIVDLNNLTGTRVPEKFKWLRDNYKPIATIDNCYLIYDVKQLPSNR